MDPISFCFVYKSDKKENCYLYIKKENDFSALPETIINYFGAPIFVMKLPLILGKKYPAGSVDMLTNRLKEQGFFIQLLDEKDFNIFPTD